MPERANGPAWPAEPEESFDVIIHRLAMMAMKRRWWLFLPTVVVGLGACGVSMMIPNQYRSEATILVTHQQIPERYVTPNSTFDIREALLIMTDAILSRTRLLQIINDFNLYPEARKRLSPEELVELMQKNIEVEPMDKGPDQKEINSFKISFTGPDPLVAQEVTTKLTTLFIQENIRTREDQSTDTTNFLEDRLRDAAADLEKQESQVRDFKMKYLGELPEQQQGNLGILNGLQMQLQSTSTALDRAREQQAYLESLLAQYRDMTPAAVTGPGQPVTDPAESIKAELTRLRSERSDLLARYTEKYPDVVKIEQEIKASEALLATAENRAARHAQESSDTNKPNEVASTDNAAIAQLNSQLQANRIEIQNDLTYEKQLQNQISDYQVRLNAAPVREQQLADLMRNYDLSKKNYDDLLSKKTQSELATTLEIRQQGQQFRIIDQPSLPMKPSGTNHLKVSFGGLAGGLALGLVLAFFVEASNHSLRDEKELKRVFAFPLMIGLPILRTKPEERRRSRRVVLEWLAGATLSLLVCAAEFYIYRRG